MKKSLYIAPSIRVIIMADDLLDGVMADGSRLTDLGEGDGNDSAKEAFFYEDDRLPTTKSVWDD